MLSNTVIGSRALALGSTLVANLLPTLTVPPQNLSGKLAVVTGSNAGIGFECVRKLARMGCTVVLACRDADKAERARQDLLSSEKVKSDAVVVERLDLGDAESVRDFAKRWEDSGSRPIDIIINNAGRSTKSYQHALNTAQPYELAYYTNILSHIQLTLSLVHFLSPNGRIVNVSSIGNYGVSRGLLDPRDLSWVQHFEGSKEQGGWGMKLGDKMLSPQSLAIYNRTKFMQVVFTKELQRYLDGHPRYQQKNIGVYVCNPGLVTTQIWTDQQGAFGGKLTLRESIVIKAVHTFGCSPEQGAVTQTWLATSPDALLASREGRGAYYERQAKREPNGLVGDDVLTREMWDAWVEAVKAEGALDV
ncbi:NAD(P)-binding protein [Clavulina sp. PMI_390]|nr:NAD(P)-binding protein [Clavulina sp. PMI_390]